MDFRYGREEMKRIFGEDARLQALLDVEAALARAHAAVGNIPKEDADAIAKAARVAIVTPDGVKEVEEETKHDLASLVKVLSERSRASGAYVHLGATSSDINDTATALQLKEAMNLLMENLFNLRQVFVDLAKKHKGTVMLGRTHGQAAIPMTFGLKIAIFAAEVDRHMQRLREALPRICVGKMTGAVGTGAALGPKALEIQKKVMEDLGVGIEEASTQIVGRDRYVELVSILAGIACSMEKFATEVRNLQRTEIGEAQEGFEETQLGSSTMAQKRNPITSENICGLARVVRGFIHPAYENVPLWHERDLTNSSSERFIVPHTCILTDDIVAKTANVFQNLVVNEERMRENIERTKGFAMGEAVMTALVEKGMDRQVAYEVVRRASRAALEEDVHLMDVLLKDEDVSKHLSDDELKKAMDPANYLGASEEIVDRIISGMRG